MSSVCRPRGHLDGLVHVSELSWKHVDHPSSVVAVGDEVTVQVLDVDLDKERISLSLKATQSDPWQDFANAHRRRRARLRPGSPSSVPFGSFVQVGDGIEGLVHISEMAVHHVELPEQVVTAGEELWVKIIDIDLERRRISLSIKQAARVARLPRSTARPSVSTPTTRRATTSVASTSPVSSSRQRPRRRLPGPTSRCRSAAADGVDDGEAAVLRAACQKSHHLNQLRPSQQALPRRSWSATRVPKRLSRPGPRRVGDRLVPEELGQVSRR